MPSARLRFREKASSTEHFLIASSSRNSHGAGTILDSPAPPLTWLPHPLFILMELDSLERCLIAPWCQHWSLSDILNIKAKQGQCTRLEKGVTTVDWQASPHGGVWIPELESSANYYLKSLKSHFCSLVLSLPLCKMGIITPGSLVFVMIK